MNMNPDKNVYHTHMQVEKLRLDEEGGGAVVRWNV